MTRILWVIDPRHEKSPISDTKIPHPDLTQRPEPVQGNLAALVEVGRRPTG